MFTRLINKVLGGGEEQTTPQPTAAQLAKAIDEHFRSGVSETDFIKTARFSDASPSHPSRIG